MTKALEQTWMPARYETLVDFIAKTDRDRHKPVELNEYEYDLVMYWARQLGMDIRAGLTVHGRPIKQWYRSKNGRA